MTVQHPYFERLDFSKSGLFIVYLSEDFPIESFVLRQVDLGTGYSEAVADVGVRVDGDEIDRICGSGDTFEEAVYDALTHFVNCVVDPSLITADDIVTYPS